MLSGKLRSDGTPAHDRAGRGAHGDERSIGLFPTRGSRARLDPWTVSLRPVRRRTDLSLHASGRGALPHRPKPPELVILGRRYPDCRLISVLNMRNRRMPITTHASPIISDSTPSA